MLKNLLTALCLGFVVPGVMFRLANSAAASPVATDIYPQVQAPTVIASDRPSTANLHSKDRSLIAPAKSSLKAAGIESGASSSQLPSLTWTQNSLAQGEPTQPSPPPNPVTKPVEPEPTVDKSKYGLFNPTPKKYWRDFATDRPDKTETPFTTDAGNWIMEADLFVYTKNNNAPDGTVTENYQVLIPNFKMGCWDQHWIGFQPKRWRDNL